MEEQLANLVHLEGRKEGRTDGRKNGDSENHLETDEHFRMESRGINRKTASSFIYPFELEFGTFLTVVELYKGKLLLFVWLGTFY